MIVIDIGCATYGGDESINALVNEFHPRFLWGYDPSMQPAEYVIDETLVTITQAAVWTYDGEIGFRIAGLGGQVDRQGRKVPCLDIAGIVQAAESLDDEVVLKLDCEGAEYELVPRLRGDHADLDLTLALIEWHCSECQMGIWDETKHRNGCPADPAAWILRRDMTQALLRCEVRPWLL
jgi:hypothetical protein